MKVFLDTIGCRLNQSEIEKLGLQFRQAGHDLVGSAAEADLVVVNTCAVTAAASADSRKRIRSAAGAGKARIVATGCYATIDPHALAMLPSVGWVVPNTHKEGLVRQVTGAPGKSTAEIEPRKPLPGGQKRTRAFVKVQDGCDNHCTFCITRIARGRSRSIPEDEISQDIESALAGGVREIVLTGVNLGSWGRDFSSRESLADLITQIIKKFQPLRLRLSSLEPWDVTEPIMAALHLPGFCQHLHLPLQSGSDEILKRMARGISTSQYARVIARIREVSADLALTTDLIVGFPGETDARFEASLQFVKQANFAGAHVFPFSVRPGTAAEQMSGRVHPRIVKERSQRMREVVAESAGKYRQKFLGKTLRVLWEKSVWTRAGWELRGLSDNYLKVQSKSDCNLYNQVSLVEVGRINSGILHGIILREG